MYVLIKQKVVRLSPDVTCEETEALRSSGTCLCPNVVMLAEAGAHKWSSDPYRSALSQPRRGSHSRSEVLDHVPVTDQTMLSLGHSVGCDTIMQWTEKLQSGAPLRPALSV